MKKLWSLALMLIVFVGQAQDKDERINRDIEVAENVLSTLIKQQMDRRSFWPIEVEGNYMTGFGVTLRVPNNNFPMGFSIATENIRGPKVWGGDNVLEITGDSFYENDRVHEEMAYSKSSGDKEILKAKRSSERDSARVAYGDQILAAAKDFMADYGDLISIEPNERILITTKSDRGRNLVFAMGGDFKAPQQRVISVEAIKSDLTQYKQNKMTRDQLMGKFKVINSEVNDESYPDLELLSTIFNRLYRPDLSKTYFMESLPYYERLKDYGATFFMQVYSSNVGDYNKYSMPTQDLRNIDQGTRDKKVIELYPAFERELKDNIVEYGRTLNSLKDNELLVFDVTLTKCKGCSIPASIELSVKASVLKEFGSGKISKEAATSKISLKKGPQQ